jgi:hypothetical protein
MIGAAREIRTPDPIITNQQLLVIISAQEWSRWQKYLDISRGTPDYWKHKRSFIIVRLLPMRML